VGQRGPFCGHTDGQLSVRYQVGWKPPPGLRCTALSERCKRVHALREEQRGPPTFLGCFTCSEGSQLRRALLPMTRATWESNVSQIVPPSPTPPSNLPRPSIVVGTALAYAQGRPRRVQRCESGISPRLQISTVHGQSVSGPCILKTRRQNGQRMLQKQITIRILPRDPHGKNCV